MIQLGAFVSLRELLRIYPLTIIRIFIVQRGSACSALD